MKTFIKKITLLCLAILFAATTKAQTGSSPQTAYLIKSPSIDTMVTIAYNSGSSFWVKYSVSSIPNFMIDITSHASPSTWKITKATAYQGNSLNFIGTDSLHSTADTVLNIFVRNGGIPDTSYPITTGNINCRVAYPRQIGNNDTVYVKLDKGTTYTCSTTKCIDALTVNFEFRVEAACSQPLYLYNTLCTPDPNLGLSTCNPLCILGQGLNVCTLTVCLGIPYNFSIGAPNGTLCNNTTVFDNGCDIFNLIQSQTGTYSGIQYTLNQYQFTPLNAGTYTISVIPSYPASQGFGCDGGTIQCPPFSFILVVLPVGIPPVLNVSPNPVCAGEPVCFTFGNQPSPGTYTFTTGNGNTTYIGTTPLSPSSMYCNNNNNTLCAYSAPGTYTATLTYPPNSNGCASTTSVNVVVNPIQVTITPSQTCDVVVFNTVPVSCVQPGATYSWDFGDPNSGNNNISNAQSPTHVYSGAGNFIATLIVSNFCGSATFHVPITSNPNCCTNTEPTNGNSSLYPRTVVHVTTSNSPYVIGLAGNGTLNVTNTDFTADAGTTIQIESPTTFNTSSFVNFNSCTFLMEPGSKIVLYTRTTNISQCTETSTLTVTFDHCHLFGCTQLWEGISFAPNNIVAPNCGNELAGLNFVTNLNINYTLLEDAFKGVDNSNAVQPKITITNSMFNKNYIDLYLDQLRLESFLPISFSKNSVYTCRQVIYNPPFVVLPNFTTAPGYITNVLGLYSAASVKPSLLHGLPNPQPAGNIAMNFFINLSLPFTTSGPQKFDISSNENIYDRHNYGVNSTEIDLQVGKQYFININNTGVLSNGYVSGNGGAPNLNIGNSNASSNNFTDCYTGIYSRYNARYLTASYNVFNGVSYGIRVDNFGTPSSGYNCNIQNNQIKNTYVNAIWFNVNNSINANVQANNIYYTGPTNYTSKGIVVNEFSFNNTNALYNIDHNTITKTYTGIECTQTYSAQITNNTIQINTPSSSLCNTCYNYGINNVNCYNNTIGTNIITGDNIQNTWWQYGINSVDHPLQNIFCNHITGTNTGLNLQGLSLTAAGLPIRNNELHEQLIDVWMLNACALGAQRFNFFFFFLPVDNLFYHTGTYLYSSYCSGNPPYYTIGSLSPFYVRSSYPYDMPVYGNQTNPAPASQPMIPVHVPGGLPNPCPAGGGIIGGRLFNLAQQVALDSLFPAADLRNTFVSRQKLFANLILENINTTGDAVLTNFKNTSANSNLGALFTVEKNITDGINQNNPALITAAAQSNNVLVASDSIQLLHKQVNADYINYLNNGFVFSPSNLNNLQQIAPLCPFIYGTAVWQARSLLAGVDSTKYANVCEIQTPPNTGGGSRVAYTQNTETSIVQNSDVGIYPNPNSGSFTVGITGKFKQLNVEVYNMLGGLVISKQFTSDNSTKLQIENLEEGVYMVKIITDGVLVKTERVIVTK